MKFPWLRYRSKWLYTTSWGEVPCLKGVSMKDTDAWIDISGVSRTSREPYVTATRSRLVFYPHGNLALATDLDGNESKLSASIASNLLSTLWITARICTRSRKPLPVVHPLIGCKCIACPFACCCIESPHSAVGSCENAIALDPLSNHLLKTRHMAIPMIPTMQRIKISPYTMASRQRFS